METTKSTTQILGGDYKKMMGGKRQKAKEKLSKKKISWNLAIEKFLLLTQSFYSIFLVQDR